MIQQVMTEPGKIIFREIETPRPAAGQVLVKIKRIGVCGSDIHVYYGEHKGTGYPVTQGHEVSGQIAALGEGVTGFHVGQKVTIEPQAVCGECYPCRHGKYNLCEKLKVMGFQTTGAASEYFAAPAFRVTALPDEMSYDEGAMIEPLAVTVHAARRFPELEGAKVAILGCGPIGILLAQSVKALGAAQVMITDISDYRLELAKKCGADYAVNTRDEDFGEAMIRCFGPDKADVIYDCAGNDITMGQAIRYARKGSKIILVAVFAKEAHVDLFTLNDHELDLDTTMMYRHEDYEEAIRLVKEGKIQLRPLMSKHFAFADYLEAYRYIEKNRETTMKVLIDVDPEDDSRRPDRGTVLLSEKLTEEPSPCQVTPAQRLVAGIHAGWNLGNTLDARKRDAKPGEIVAPGEAETAWGNPPVTKSMIHCVQDAGFDAVRLPVTWTQHIDADGKIDPAWLERVAEVAGWILDAGMVCLLNVHHDAGAHGWLQATEACHAAYGGRFEYLWRQIAERFADTGENLVFEAFNEMLDGKEHWTQTPDDEAYRAHNRWHQRFIDTIRDAGGFNAERIVSLQSYSAGNTARTLDAFQMPADKSAGRIILQTHNYDPTGFCWLRAEGQPMRDTWGSETDRENVGRLMNDLSAFADRHGAPLIIGEFGSEDKQNTEARARHASWFTRKAREKGIVCFWWDCGHFALFDRRAEKLLHREIADALCAG